MKKIVLFIYVLCGFSTYTYSLGFYGGLALSTEQTSIDNRLTYPLEASSPSTANETLCLSTISKGIIVGYIHDFQASPWGVDAYISTNVASGSVSSTVNNWFGSIQAKETYSMDSITDLTFAARYVFTDKIDLYFGPTASHAKFSIKPGATGGVLGVSSASSSISRGYGLIFGIEMPLYKHFNIRFSYRTIDYESITWEATEPESESRLRQKITPTTRSFQFALIYRL